MLKVNLIIKRTIDIVASGVSLVLLMPLFLIIATIIKMDSSGPVFFKQSRLGKDGIEFRMYKFRSMVVNAEKMGTGLFNYADDPRVTKAGYLLRKTSLDELPQLLNVFCGDMSLVGPRPAVKYELGDFNTLNSRYKKRFTVLPGITGYAQVKGRNCCGWDQKVNYDNEYIELFNKQGLFLDIKILFLTIANVFTSKNIYEEKPMDYDNDLEAAAAAEVEVIRKAHEPEQEGE